MPTVCLICNLRALAHRRPAPFIPEEPAEHMRQCHPDPLAMLRERRELLHEIARDVALSRDTAFGKGRR